MMGLSLLEFGHGWLVGSESGSRVGIGFGWWVEVAVDVAMCEEEGERWLGTVLVSGPM